MQAQMPQTRTNRRTGEVQAMQNGQWVTVTPPRAAPAPMSGFQLSPGDPLARETAAERLRGERLNNRERELRIAREDPSRAAGGIDPALTGPAALDAMTPADRRMVQSMIDGRVTLPTQGRMATDANWQRWMALAQQVDPQIDQNTIRNRQHAQQSWLTGPDHRNVQSLSTALEHVDGLRQSITALHNFNNLPLSLNNVANRYENWMHGGGSRASVLNDFRTRAHTVAGEVATAVKGGQATIDDIRGYESQLSPDMSPDALNATVDAMTDQISARIRESRNAYRAAMGRPDVNLPLISPTAARVLADRGQGDLVDSNAAPPGPAAPPQAGPPPGPGGGGGERMDATHLTFGQDAGPGMHLSSTEQADPTRAAYNAHIQSRFSQMVHGGASDQAIQAYGAANQLDPTYTANILAWRRGVPQTGSRGTFRQWDREHPGGLLPLRDMNPNRPLTGGAQLVASGIESTPGTALTQAADAVVPLSVTGRLVGADPNQVNNAVAAQQDQRPGAALLGRVAGTAAAYWAGGRLAGMAGRAILPAAEVGAAGGEAAAPLTGINAARQRVGSFLTGGPGAEVGPLNARAITGDALYGAEQGTGNGDPIGGALSSMAGGAGGRAGGRIFGSLLTGATDPAVRYLTARGIPLTIGQIAGQGGRIGQALRGIENRFSGINPLIDNQYRSGLRAFNGAAFDDAVAPIGGTAPRQVGERGLENVRGQRSDAYSGALDGQSFTGDQAFSDQMHTLIRDGRSIPGLGDQFNHIINTRVAPMFSPNGEISGTNFQAALKGIRAARTEFAGQPLGHDFGQALTGVDDALTGLVQRQAPNVMPVLRAANAANRNVSILGDAVRRGQATVQNGEPLFTPFQLNAASIANTTKYGGRDAATSTGRPFFDLTRNAQEVLPNRVPDTGSGSRALAPLALSAGIGVLGTGSDATGLTEHGHGSETAAGLMALLSLPHTNIGRAALQGLLVKRPDWLRALGENVSSANIPGTSIYGGLTIPQAWGMFGSAGAAYGNSGN